MGDARAAARTWLAERYRDAATLCDDSVCHECGGNPCESHVLDAILSAPGVEVDEVFEVATSAWSAEADDAEHAAWYATQGASVTRRPVIRLPAQPIGETP